MSPAVQWAVVDVDADAPENANVNPELEEGEFIEVFLTPFQGLHKTLEVSEQPLLHHAKYLLQQPVRTWDSSEPQSTCLKWCSTICCRTGSAEGEGLGAGC